MGLRIIQVDAFTDTPFAGNPAAVCVLPEPRQAAWMQQVAREMNLSETAFPMPATTGADYRLRIFTPEVELPFAGHPSIGAAWVLAQRGELAAPRKAISRWRSRLTSCETWSSRTAGRLLFRSSRIRPTSRNLLP